MQKPAEIEARFARLADEGRTLLTTVRDPPPNVIGPRYVDRQLYATWRAQSEARLEATFGREHAFTRNFRDKGDNSAINVAQHQVGVIDGALAAIRAGDLESLSQLVVADVFADFLDMADHLQEQGYYAPAVVLTAGVLEDALRRLCGAHQIKYGPREDLSALNNKLASAKPQAYDSVDRKRINAWADIRNDAAHGRAEKVTKERSEDVLRGVAAFLAMHPDAKGERPSE
jgi:hypothetical protein